MIVLVLEHAPPILRGELTRWLLETKPGVFVGKVSATVRERLWSKVTQCQWENGALMIFSSDSEQGFSICMCGEPARQVVDLEGVQLIKIKENP